MIQITESALRNAQRLRSAEGHPPDAFLRLGAKGGGCSGYSYVLQFDTNRREDDEIVEHNDEIEVRVDPKSRMFLEGLTLDFSEGLGGKGFEFLNPNAKSSCGCGKSFAI